MSILSRYIFRELIPPFIIGLFILVILILTQQTLLIMNLLVNKGLSPGTVARLILAIFPQFLTMIIPVSVLAASTAVFHRLASDGEIIAIKASGIGISRLIPPLALFALIGFALSLGMSLKAMETQGMSLQDMLLTVLQKKLSLGIKPQSFNNFMNKFVIYVDRMPTFSRMNGIFIYEKPVGKNDAGSVIIAKEGHLENEINPPGLRLKLTSGTLYREGTYQQFVRFDSYDLTILGSIPKGESRHILSISELQKKIRESKTPKSDDLRQLEDRYKNYTYPFSCIIFAFMGIPFGIYAKRSGKLSGFVFATTSVIVFYMLNTIDDLLVARKLLPPLLASLIPDLVLGSVMVFLLILVFREIEIPQMTLPKFRFRRKASA